ncbi:coiled-coil domain-containing protein 55-domain containing protein [Blyttiomyces helicus]|uniref:Coiled-coil domain-containing protein 55-domain containing protein n=1 Tax=Blyttiomyces helicus TaxID=388810 RepID=A0A4P9WHQ0_9FUNG|nr:coiled-coil domain-containing protein 55-domain containing protein [Blyttiomyces helicus]|eukprot:RKO90958.1 coiled-coil domain-containing protein 55-domain containing protein [Blyttiomyces helicus]
MANLMKAAQQRKLDLERAEERKVQREREEEGEEFGDKEKFVTGAYMERQRELRRLEEEEKKREELEGDVTKKNDLSGFYRDYLNKAEQERSKIAVPVVAPEAATPVISNTDAEADANLSDSIKQRAIASGLVQLNDSDEVVDKRQLLAGGLNITSRAIRQRALESEEREREAAEYRARKEAEEEDRRRETERRRAARDQAARARDLVVRQQEEHEETEKKRKDAEREEVVKKLARQTTEETVSDARARYLARKKAEGKKGKTEEED